MSRMHTGYEAITRAMGQALASGMNRTESVLRTFGWQLERTFLGRLKEIQFPSGALTGLADRMRGQNFHNQFLDTFLTFKEDAHMNGTPFALDATIIERMEAMLASHCRTHNIQSIGDPAQWREGLARIGIDPARIQHLLANDIELDEAVGRLIGTVGASPATIAAHARPLHKFFTHNAGNNFSGQRTLAFAAGAAIIVGAVYWLTHKKEKQPAQQNWKQNVAATETPQPATQR